eukprot:CAMPEP_0177766998 /NCGR_PEP_ID=MMETSP0491_2-20121128/8833_1 /TAXON_ID=63592 /ORGANISM="Tetraselmis chuii, Strain PLY429" /LENGTH=258 /DNA_ID=CAMNT_0019283469 /DNA_START=95 /DNA_END=871 /DNA_ORIENTATION=-
MTPLHSSNGCTAVTAATFRPHRSLRASCALRSIKQSTASPLRRAPQTHGGASRRRALRAHSSSANDAAEAKQETAPAAEFDPYDKLNEWQLLRIVTQDMPDEEVNELAWECLGYVKSFDMNPETLTVETVWDNSRVFPKWRANYPTPPDLIGVTRKYYPEIDAPIKEANAALARSIPLEHKKGLKEALAPLGWKGFKMAGLTPNKTRRAQVANWLVFYRKELRGVSLEELQQRKAAREAKEKEAETERFTGTSKQGVV